MPEINTLSLVTEDEMFGISNWENKIILIPDECAFDIRHVS